MSGFIEKLKQKPDDVKNRIAIFIAISVTVIIALLWMMVLRNQSTDDVVRQRSSGEDLKPLFMIFGNAKEAFDNIKEVRDKNNQN